MTTQRLTHNVLVFSAALALSACGDDGSGSGSGSASATGTGGTASGGTMSGGTMSTSSGGTSQGSGTATGGTSAGTAGTSAGTAGTSAGTAGTSAGTAGTSAGTAGTSGGTAGTSGGTAGTGGTGGTGGTTGGIMACELAKNQLPCDDQDNDPFHAIGLGCDSLGGNWNASNSVSIQNESMNAAPGNALLGKPWQVGTMFGNATYGPMEGGKVLVISSGLIPDSNGGVITEDSSSDDAGGGSWDSNSLPPPAIPVDGDTDPDPMVINCNLMGDCTNTIQTQWEKGNGNPDDKMWFEFDVTAPSLNNGDVADANGYKFDFAFLSEEFPEWVDTTFNDMFIVWQASTNFTGNVVFINDQPITVTALWDNATGVDYIGECPTGSPPVIPGCVGMAAELAGTDLVDDGAGTGWYTATGGVEPGETFKLMFMIMDMGDSILNSYAVIDNWRWDCEGCVPSEVNDCGIAPQ